MHSLLLRGGTDITVQAPWLCVDMVTYTLSITLQLHGEMMLITHQPDPTANDTTLIVRLLHVCISIDHSLSTDIGMTFWTLEETRKLVCRCYMTESEAVPYLLVTVHEKYLITAARTTDSIATSVRNTDEHVPKTYPQCKWRQRQC